MAVIEFTVTDNECVKSTPLLGFEDLYKDETIITKEAFIKCYNKWIKADKGEEE